MPVMEPLSEVPARSRSLGRRVEDARACSRAWPAARPTARPDLALGPAKRVTESIMSMTSVPWSRKYSATAVAT